MLVGTSARAVAQPAPVALALSPCAAEVAPSERLVGLLQIELGATLDRPMALVVSDVDAGTNDANVSLRLDCTETRDVLDLQITRRQPPGVYRGRVNVAQLPERMWPRTIALAIAEELRWLDAPAPPPEATVEPKVKVTPPPAMAPSPPPPRSLRNPAKLHRARWWVVGLITASALTSAGGFLLHFGLKNPTDAGEVAGGGVLLTMGIDTLAGSIIGLSYWLRERLRPLPPRN
jgi:hypothetical protein